MTPDIWNRAGRRTKHSRSNHEEDYDPFSLLDTSRRTTLSNHDENPKHLKRPRLIEWNHNNHETHVWSSSAAAQEESSFTSFRDETSRDSHASEESSSSAACQKDGTSAVPERIMAAPPPVDDTLENDNFTATVTTTTTGATDCASGETNIATVTHHEDDDDDGTVVASNTSTMTDLEDWVEGLTFGKSSWSLLDLKAARLESSANNSSSSSHHHEKRANAAFIRAKQRDARRCMLQHYSLHPTNTGMTVQSEISTIQENP
jgi:hypothetical protein